MFIKKSDLKPRVTYIGKHHKNFSILDSLTSAYVNFESNTRSISPPVTEDLFIIGLISEIFLKSNSPLDQSVNISASMAHINESLIKSFIANDQSSIFLTHTNKPFLKSFFNHSASTLKLPIIYVSLFQTFYDTIKQGCDERLALIRAHENCSTFWSSVTACKHHINYYKIEVMFMNHVLPHLVDFSSFKLFLSNFSCFNIVPSSNISDNCNADFIMVNPVRLVRYAHSAKSYLELYKLKCFYTANRLSIHL